MAPALYIWVVNKSLPTKDESASLWADAFAYREAYGDSWPDEAFAHLKALTRQDDHAAVKRWIALIDLLTEFEQPATRN